MKNNGLKIEKITDDHGIYHIIIHGNLDLSNFQELKFNFDEKLKDRGAKYLIDLMGVEFVASSGWAVLLADSNFVYKNGGRIAAFGLDDNLERVHTSLKAKIFLPIFDTEKEAVDFILSDKDRKDI